MPSFYSKEFWNILITAPTSAEATCNFWRSQAPFDKNIQKTAGLHWFCRLADLYKFMQTFSRVQSYINYVIYDVIISNHKLLMYSKIDHLFTY
ncbi:hypothetical protein GCM10027085_53270 [Spirosoma aerophilum]